MRTRVFDAMTNAEITDYLRHNDLIFLPVGVVEMHGEMPLGCEHVLPLAFAIRMAEIADGLVLPHLAYFYAGATAIGRGTISVSPSEGAAYLKAVCCSLCRQGFRRQVLLSAHGPAHLTLSHAAREVFEQTKCAVIYLDLVKHFGDLDFNQLLWGAYHLLGRLDEIPTEQKPSARAPFPEAVARLHQAKVEAGYYFSDETHHGWWPDHPLSPQERIARAEEGARAIDTVLEAIDPRSLAEDMKSLDKFVQHHVLPKYEDRL